MNIWKSGNLLEVRYQLSKGYFELKILEDSDSETRIFSSDILHIISCCSVDDYTAPFFIDLFLARLNPQEAHTKMLSKGYQWKELIGLSSDIWHLHMEGGVVMDIFSTKSFVEEQNITN